MIHCAKKMIKKISLNLQCVEQIVNVKWWLSKVFQFIDKTNECIIQNLINFIVMLDSLHICRGINPNCINVSHSSLKSWTFLCVCISSTHSPKDGHTDGITIRKCCHKRD